MRTALVACLLATLACAAPDPRRLHLEGERTLLDCERERVDTSLCQSLELIQAEYRLCQREHPDDSTCEAVWSDVARLTAPPRLPPPPLFQRGALRAR